MATRRYGLSPGKTEFQVVETVGAAVAADVVEVTVDFGTTTNDRGTTRKISRDEVLTALKQIQNHLLKSKWPPI